MAEYLSPGVYVEEVDTGARPIEGVSTSTAGMVGMTERGSTEGLPELVTSFGDFRRKFGGYYAFDPAIVNTDDNAYKCLPYAVDGFFRNGGKRLYIKRVPGTGATPSEITAKGSLVTRLEKDVSVNPSERNIVFLKTLRGIDNGTLLTFVQVKDGVSTTLESMTVSSYIPRTGQVTLSGNLQLAYEEKYTTVTVASGEYDRDTNTFDTFVIRAKNPGSWGQKIDIKAEHESVAGSDVDSWVGDINENGNNFKLIKLKSTAGFYVGAWVEIDRGQTKSYEKIEKIEGQVIKVTTNEISPGDMTTEVTNQPIHISTCEFRMFVSYDGIDEEFSGLTLEKVIGRYYFDMINKSELINVEALGDTASTHPKYFPSGDDGLHIVLEGGKDGDGSPTVDDYRGTDGGPGNRSGIQAFRDIDQVSIIMVPGIADQAVQQALITHCELLKDRFAILDPQNIKQTLKQIQDQRLQYDTKYAAIYYPRIMVRDPLTKTDIVIPPSGHMAGIYARTDNERGVHKAPANEVIRGITGLEQIINKGEQDILNPKPNHINVLRDFRKSGRGYRVWGARCITNHSDWKYINVRRLFIFIEESIEEGTQWVVFEPNDEPTWARVRRSVRNFLTDVWRDGALRGSKPDEAFFVKCDRSTMSETDILNGKCIIEIGIAAVTPAEFVIFRIGQWARGSEIEE